MGLGDAFRKLALKSINDWIDQLTKDSIKLARDDGIYKGKGSGSKRSSMRLSHDDESSLELFQERQDLIKILQGMIGTAMKMVKRSQRDVQAQQIERSAIEIGDTSDFIPLRRASTATVPSLTVLPPVASASTHLRAPTPDPYLDPNEIAAFQQSALQQSDHPEYYPASPMTPAFAGFDSRRASRDHSRNPSRNPSCNPSRNASRNPSRDHSRVPSRSASRNDSYELEPDTSVILQLYTSAQSHLATNNPAEALDSLETALLLLDEVPPHQSSSAPSRTDVLFLISTACFKFSPIRITRARQALREICGMDNVKPAGRRFEAAHTLAQSYIFSDGNIDDPTVEWNSFDMNLEKAKEYIIIAVKGRNDLFGLASEETQRSVNLLAALCQRVGSSDDKVLKELLDVLRGIFAETRYSDGVEYSDAQRSSKYWG